jgi:hypothetical protein
VPKPPKYLLLLFAFTFGNYCFAQRITGIVTDKSTHIPIEDAQVTLHGSTTSSNKTGGFSINAAGVTDTIHVISFGYKPFSLPVNKSVTTLRLELQPLSVILKPVVIHANRDSDFVKDSIANRQAYAKQFNYVGPKVMDAFTGNMNRQPGELISINPILLVAALTKKSTPEYKFKQKLLADEQAEYISRKFNRGIVFKLTGLKGDTIATFLVNYRPDYTFAKKATDYDMITYIKDKYSEFAKGGFKADNLFR